MSATLFLPLIPLIALFHYALVLFDRLLRAEYELHRPVWEADGRLAGFFWRPGERRYISPLSHLATMHLAVIWLFRTPLWVAESATLRACLWRLRIALSAGIVGLLIWLMSFLRFI